MRNYPLLKARMEQSFGPFERLIARNTLLHLHLPSEMVHIRGKTILLYCL